MATQDIGFEEMVLAAAATALEEQGIPVEPFRTETGYGLQDEEAGSVLHLDNVTRSAARAGREWRETVLAWIGQYTAARAERLHEPTPDELRASIRTRLILENEDRTYARPFAHDLVVALAIDGATTVQTHSDQSLAKSPIDVAELYRLGQANTDAEPIDDIFQVDGDVYAISGESFFIASKVANFPALLNTIGPAPLGVAFCPLNRSLVLYTTIAGTGADGLGPVMGLAQRVDALATDGEFDHPGGLLSDTTFYWAPDGRVEYLARQSMLLDGEPTITVSPGSAFSEFVMTQESGD